MSEVYEKKIRIRFSKTILEVLVLFSFSKQLRKKIQVVLEFSLCSFSEWKAVTESLKKISILLCKTRILSLKNG
ncbi:hypothetical protein CH380_03355 [Leptospira adleri]|uniref:Uncharacterized protein n=1 Tax=Leptospira adleri TaxID=2023186 RepID=A0A2M9YT92_9LEPT|nr:hypothetical protein CH380_03355 [Leptospira adleri]PJZ61428.1 hypothetical protein CH376_13080 [Leptospira adleri]